MEVKIPRGQIKNNAGDLRSILFLPIKSSTPISVKPWLTRQSEKATYLLNRLRKMDLGKHGKLQLKKNVSHSYFSLVMNFVGRATLNDISCTGLLVGHVLLNWKLLNASHL